MTPMIHVSPNLVESLQARRKTDRLLGKLAGLFDTFLAIFEFTALPADFLPANPNCQASACSP